MVAGGWSPGAGSGKVPDFHADVAPILRDYCAACHSGGEREGDLNVETYEALRKGGEHGSVLPKSDGGEGLLSGVLHGKRPAMPPKKEAQPTPEELAVLDAWLKAGAPGPRGADVSILSLVTVPEMPLKVAPSKGVSAAAVSVAGGLEALGGYRWVEVRDGRTHAVVRRFEGVPGKVNGLAFSPDGTRLVAASGVGGVSGMVLCWDLRDAGGERARILEGGHRDAVQCVRWSPDGKIVASGGYDSRVVLWDAASGNKIRTLQGHHGAVFDVAFRKDGTLLASASADQTVKVWRVRDGERLDTLKDAQGEVLAVAFTPKGDGVVASGADRRVRSWRLRSVEAPAINPVWESRYAHEASVVGLCFLPEGDRLVTTALDRTMKVWSFPGLELLRTLPVQSEVVSGMVACGADSQWFVARMDGSSERITLEGVGAVHGREEGFVVEEEGGASLVAAA
ncbi:MAG: hypothetical protein RLZZ244_508, partial [Verrucomicrobiota bacterium]